MPVLTDIDLTTRDIAGLTSPDTLTSFLSKLGYKTNARTALTPEAVGLSGDSACAIKKIELLVEDDEAVPPGRLRPAEVADRQGPQ